MEDHDCRQAADRQTQWFYRSARAQVAGGNLRLDSRPKLAERGAQALRRDLRAPPPAAKGQQGAVGGQVLDGTEQGRAALSETERDPARGGWHRPDVSRQPGQPHGQARRRSVVLEERQVRRRPRRGGRERGDALVRQPVDVRGQAQGDERPSQERDQGADGLQGPIRWTACGQRRPTCTTARCRPSRRCRAPAKDRPTTFWLGHREHDPVRLGYRYDESCRAGSCSTPRCPATATLGTCSMIPRQEQAAPGRRRPRAQLRRARGPDRVPEVDVSVLPERGPRVPHAIGRRRRCGPGGPRAPARGEIIPPRPPCACRRRRARAAPGRSDCRSPPRPGSGAG